MLGPPRALVSFLVALTIWSSSFALATSGGEGDSEIMLVDALDLRLAHRIGLMGKNFQNGAEFFADDEGPDLQASVEFLENLGTEILEVYGSYVLARVDNPTRSHLRTLGIAVETLTERRQIPLGKYPFSTANGEPSVPPSLRATSPQGGQSEDFIVQFIGPMKESWFDAISAVGGEVRLILGRFALVVRMTATEADVIGNMISVEWVGLFHPAYKVPPSLLMESGTLDIVLSLFPGELPDSVADMVLESEGQVLESWFGGLRARVEAEIFPI